ncbi:Kef-type K+ transport system membrane component KefB [Bradyrhizobium diazoefficiens]
MSAPVVLALMSICFLSFGYLGVPVPFSLMAGVFIGAILSDVSLAAIIQKIFDGVDSPRRCWRSRSSCWSASS